MSITAKKFKNSTGFVPVDDDLERCNCELVGTFGHSMCGWDEKRDMPNFMPGIGKTRLANTQGE